MINSKKDFKRKLVNNDFSIDFLLRNNNLKLSQDITKIPNLGKERFDFRMFKKETMEILAKTVSEYVDEKGALLRYDMDLCILDQVSKQSNRNYSEEKRKYFVKSISATNTNFQEMLYHQGIKKKSRAIKNLYMNFNHRLDLSNVEDYDYSTMFYINKEDALEYLFSKFGKIKRLDNLSNNGGDKNKREK